MINQKFKLYVWAVVWYNLLTAMWGAYVRATGAGAGCGEHWPLCNGRVIPRAQTIETLVEFSHRLTSGVALISVLVLLYWAYKSFPKNSQIRKWAAVTVGFMLMEAALGAGLVLFGLVDKNISMGRVFAMGIHLVNTFLLFASMSICAWHASRGDSQVPKVKTKKSATSIAILLLLVTVGVAGAITALGDTLFPPETVGGATVYPDLFAAHFLVNLRIMHPILAVMAALLIISYALRFRDESYSENTRLWAKWTVIFIVIQLCAGLANIILKVPVWLQLVHLMLAYAVWISTVLLIVSSNSVEIKENK